MEIYSVPSKHRPIHYYIDNTIYFLTTTCFRWLFDSDERKEIVYEVIKKTSEKFGIKIYAWVINHNHVHLLFYLKKGKDISKISENINSNISRLLNKLDNEPGRQNFKNYWDYCIRDEKDFYTHFNYIHHNPVKHKICKNQHEVSSFTFCIYGRWVEKMGEEWALSCFAEYPIIDFTVRDDN